jgi:hypothetical protein
MEITRYQVRVSSSEMTEMKEYRLVYSVVIINEGVQVSLQCCYNK